MPKRSVFLLDDNLYFLSAAIEFIKTDENFNVIGHSLKGDEALEIIKKEKPEIIIVDYVMSGMNGIEVTKIIKSMDYSPIVIIITQFDSQDYKEQALQNGADGFVPKTKFGEEIIPTIQSLLS